MEMSRVNQDGDLDLVLQSVICVWEIYIHACTHTHTHIYNLSHLLEDLRACVDKRPLPRASLHLSSFSSGTKALDQVGH